MKHDWTQSGRYYDKCANCGISISISKSGDGECIGKPKTMNTPVTTEFDLAVVASGYAFTERERHIAKWFYNRGKHGRSKRGLRQ